MSKPKIGFYWCASCGGCEESLVDLGDELLNVAESVEFAFFPCTMDFKRKDVEHLQDEELALSFINGAIRTSEQEEMVELLRSKSRLIIAYGSCSHTGGIPGLSNLYEKKDILNSVYLDNPSTDNPKSIPPKEKTEINNGTLSLPVFRDTVRTLDQTIEVDYFLPGCPPPVPLIQKALNSILENQLPQKGSVLAPDIALCEDCPRNDTKPDKLLLKEFQRPHQITIDPEKCLLAQGLLCLGIVTRSGCEAQCINANMPCTGCLGPTSRVWDYGTKALSAIASLIDSNDEHEITRIIEQIPDPEGTFYRYSLPGSLIHARINVKKEDEQ